MDQNRNRKRKVCKRSAASCAVSRDWKRKRRLEMTDDERAAERERDRLRKRKRISETACCSSRRDSDSDDSEIEGTFSSRVTERKYLEMKDKKFAQELQSYGVTDALGLFGKKLHDIKWHTCMKCKTKMIGVRQSCFCRKNYVMQSKLMNICPVPLVLSRLSLIEQLLIATVHPVIRVYRLRGGQLSMGGHVVNFFQDVKSFATKLPHAVADLHGVIAVCCETDKFQKDFKIRKTYVIEALEWLKKHNKYYHNIEIDSKNVESLPKESQYHNIVPVGNPEDDPVSDEETDNVTECGVPNAHLMLPEDKLKHNLKWPTLDSAPIDEFNTSGYIVQAFPTLFPNGEGDLKEVQSKHLTARVYFQYLMEYYDGRFASHPTFPYFGMNSVMRWECCTKGTVYLRHHPDLKSKNVELIRELIQSGEPIGRDLMVYSSSIRSSKDYWMARSSELQSMVGSIGLPTLFFTFSAADFHWPRLFDLLLESCGKETVTETERHKIMLDNPKICCDYFFEIIEMYMNDIIIVHFRVTDHWYRFEWQARGSPHVHGTLWLLNSVDVKQLFHHFDKYKEEVVSYFDNLVSCINPNTNFVEVGEHPSRIRIEDIEDASADLEALINTLQRHTKHSKRTCLKYDKRIKEYVCKHNFPKELREQSTITTNKKGYFEFEGKRNDPLLNKCNHFMLQSLRSNGDVTAIVSEGGFMYYIAKYAAKPETKSKHLLDIFSTFLEKQKTRGKLISALRSTFMSCLVERDYSAQEVHHLLGGKKLVSCSRSFVKLNLKLDNWKYYTSLSLTDGATFSDTCNEVMKKYTLRPEGMKNVCLYEFAQKYNIYTYSPRRRCAIVQVYPRLKVGSVSLENFDVARQLLLLYVPWKALEEVSDIPEVCLQLQEKHKLTVEMLPYYSKKESIMESVSDDESDTENADGLKDVSNILEEWMFLSNAANEGEVLESNLGCRNIDVEHDWKTDVFPSEEISHLITFIDEKKREIVISKVKLSTSVKLNHEQKEVLSIVQKRIQRITRGHSVKDLPQFVVVQASAGCGKSTVINAVVDEVIQYLGEKCILVMGPTGSSANTVQGETIHRALHLQFGNSTGDVEDLKAETLHQYQLRVKDVIIVVVDEFSMVGCRMLHTINRRLMQLKGSKEMFGGCLVMLFGDVKQLPPVADVPLYRCDVTHCSEAAKAGSLLFRSIDIVKTLSVPHRQLNVPFKNFLDKVSKACVTETDKQYIRTCFAHNMAGEENERFRNAVHLYQTRDKVHVYNESKLIEMNLPVLKISAQNNNKVAGACSEELALNLLQDLYLCIGAEVMLRSNLWTEAGLTNGAIGVVRKFLFSAENSTLVPDVVLVEFSNYKGPTVSDNCVPIAKVLRSWYVSGTYCTRFQFPLVLAYSMTYHKCQSLTLPKVVCHMEEKEKSAGVFYVGMSRVKTKEDLQIVGSFENCPLFTMNTSLYAEKLKAELWLMEKAKSI